MATTFINMNCSEQILLDLKHLLREAKQRVPPVLEALEDPTEKFKDLSGGTIKKVNLLMQCCIVLININFHRLYVLWRSGTSYS